MVRYSVQVGDGHEVVNKKLGPAEIHSRYANFKIEINLRLTDHSVYANLCRIALKCLRSAVKESGPLTVN